MCKMAEEKAPSPHCNIMKPIWPTVEVLRKLKEGGYPLYGLSNWPSDKFDLVRPKYEFFSWFDDIVVSGKVRIAKPDPRIFRPALEAIGVEAADVLFVGDSVTSDMAAARNASMDFCWVNPKGLPCPADHAPAFVIASIAEFPAL